MQRLEIYKEMLSKLFWHQEKVLQNLLVLTGLLKILCTKDTKIHFSFSEGTLKYEQQKIGLGQKYAISKESTIFFQSS